MNSTFDNQKIAEDNLASKVQILEDKLSEVNATFKNFYDLTVLTNTLSSKIKNSESENMLYRTLISELRDNNHPSSIYLLDETKKRLNLSFSTIDNDNSIISRFEKIVENIFGNLKLSRKGFNINLENSVIYRDIVEKKYLHHMKTSDLVEDMFPRLVGKFVSKLFNYDNSDTFTAIAPLLVRGETIGILAMDAYRDKDYFLPFVENLSKTISKELERIKLELEKRDINAKKNETEDIFEKLYSNSPDGIMIGKIVYDNSLDLSERTVSEILSIKANDRFRNLMNIGSEDLFGKRVSEINPMHNDKFLGKYIIPAMNGESVKFNIHMGNKETDYSCSIFDLGYDMFAMILNDITGLQKIKKNLEETVSALEKSVNITNLLLKEVNHRTKNNLNVIGSIVNLEKMRIDDLEKDDYVRILSDIENRIYVVSGLCETLYKSGDYKTLDVSYFRDLAERLWSSYDTSSVNFKINISDSCRLGIDSAVPCGMILNEMISNSIKYAFPDDIYAVPNKDYEKTIDFSMNHVGENNNLIELLYSDNGIGMPQNYSLANSKSLGITLISSLVDQLRGKLEVISGYRRNIISGSEHDNNFKNEPGVGTRYIIRF